jgi:hypothetical protein
VSDAAVPLVWLSEAGPHRDEAARALGEWARARGVVLAEASPPAQPSIAVDPTVPDVVEKDLARAHEAADADTAERALAHADAILRAHPEAPAAPFLRAEVLRAWAKRWADERSVAAWQDAEALDGGRVAGIGEKSVPPPARTTLTIHADASVTVDGRPTNGRVEVLPGEHAVVATRDGAIVYAAWVAVRGPLELTLPASDDACSLPALAKAKRAGDRVTAAGVTCPAWVAAEPSAHGVLVARCAADACSSLSEWRRSADVAFVPARPRESSLPAWATWTVVGISAATIASVVLIASGVFETRPVEPRFVVGGVRQE